MMKLLGVGVLIQELHHGSRLKEDSSHLLKERHDALFQDRVVALTIPHSNAYIHLYGLFTEGQGERSLAPRAPARTAICAATMTHRGPSLP